MPRGGYGRKVDVKNRIKQWSKNKKNKEFCTLYLDTEIQDQLEAYCQARDIRKEVIIHTLLRDFLKEDK